MRIIKRYSNRKLYDTHDSRYVTLDQLAVLVREGEELQVVDKSTERDLTSATLAQIIFEEEKRTPKLPMDRLTQIIRTGMPAEA
jgi:polyhydroxyalkanoate synthesis repressor PhaR